MVGQAEAACATVHDQTRTGAVDRCILHRTARYAAAPSPAVRRRCIAGLEYFSARAPGAGRIRIAGETDSSAPANARRGGQRFAIVGTPAAVRAVVRHTIPACA